MDIVKEFFDIKKEFIIKYASLLSEGFTMENKDYYLSEYANVYVDSYYLESFETIEYKPYFETSTSDISKELKGKYYELIYKEEKKGKINNNIKRSISLAHTFITIAIIADLQDYSKCELIKDYEEIIKKIIEAKSNIIKIPKDNVNKLIREVKKVEENTKKYLKSLETDSVRLRFKYYQKYENRCKVKMKAHFRELEKHKKIVLDKVINSKEVYREKLKLELNIINSIILRRLLRKREGDYYFLELKTEYLNKYIIEDIKKYVDNPVSRKYIIFTLRFNDYNTNRTSIKEIKNYKYACLLDVSRIKEVNTRLDSFIVDKTFDYIILDNIREDQKKQLKNYTLEGKDIMYSEYKISQKEV